MAKAVKDDFEDLDDLDEAEEAEASSSSKSASKAKAKAKPAGLTATMVAEKCGADPKTFRAWLRGQVEKGTVELPERQGRERYILGKNWKDPVVTNILTLWKETDHRKGGKKKADGEKAPAKKRPAKKTSAKGKPASRKRTAKK